MAPKWICNQKIKKNCATLYHSTILLVNISCQCYAECRMEEYGMPEEETLEDLDRISIAKREIELVTV